MKQLNKRFCVFFYDLRPAEGPIKSPLSVCPLSVRRFGIFLWNESLVFSDFLQGSR